MASCSARKHSLRQADPAYQCGEARVGAERVEDRPIVECRQESQKPLVLPTLASLTLVREQLSAHTDRGLGNMPASRFATNIWSKLGPPNAMFVGRAIIVPCGS